MVKRDSVIEKKFWSYKETTEQVAGPRNDTKVHEHAGETHVSVSNRNIICLSVILDDDTYYRWT